MTGRIQELNFSREEKEIRGRARERRDNKWYLRNARLASSRRGFHLNPISLFKGGTWVLWPTSSALHLPALISFREKILLKSLGLFIPARRVLSYRSRHPTSVQALSRVRPNLDSWCISIKIRRQESWVICWANNSFQLSTDRVSAMCTEEGELEPRSCDSKIHHYFQHTTLPRLNCQGPTSTPKIMLMLKW